MSRYSVRSSHQEAALCKRSRTLLIFRVEREETEVNPQTLAWQAVQLITSGSDGADPYQLNPFRPEFTIVIFIPYKPRIAVAILGL